MKRFLLCLLMVVVPSIMQAQQWDWLYPYPTTNRMIDFFFVDQNTGFIIAENGEILMTTNGCSSWRDTTFENTNFIDICFTDVNHGWILAEEGSGWSVNGVVLVTEDGGITWNSYDISSYIDVSTIYFVSTTHGWIGGYDGLLMNTTNGGKTWNDQSLYGGYGYYGYFYDGVPSIYYLHFTDNQNGVFFGNFPYYEYGFEMGLTTNGGSTWERKRTGLMNEMYGGCYKESGVYYTLGELGMILETSNQGSNWSFPSNNPNTTLYGIDFSDTDVGWAVGGDSTVLKTTNGGKSWEHQSTGVSSEFRGVQFIDPNHGWIMGTENGTQSVQAFLYTSDGGDSWDNQFLTFDQILDFNDVCFVDQNNGWLVTNERIYRSKDGGRQWVLQREAENTGYWYSDEEYYNAIHFSDTLNGWIAGRESYNGMILRTTDGGTSWNKQSYSFISPLENVYFISYKIGWFVGNDGMILRTMTAGQTVEIQTSNTTYNVVDVYFLDENYGYAVTYGDYFLKTQDGGLNWESVQFTTSYSPDGRSIFFSDTLNGWIGTDEGLYHTTNGGNIWNSQTLTSHKYITGLNFIDDQEGWALARSTSYSYPGGVVYHTTNGGDLWEEELTSGKNLYGFSFVPEGYGWAVGQNSVIARYTHSEPFTTSIKSTENSAIPKIYRLYQCYPNPFNAATTIVYDLPERSNVKLKVFNIQGQEIKTVISEIKDAGRYTVDLDMGGYSSGTYFYRIITDRYMDTKKLVLIK